jgi:hypothetical protein
MGKFQLKYVRRFADYIKGIKYASMQVYVHQPYKICICIQQ